MPRTLHKVFFTALCLFFIAITHTANAARYTVVQSGLFSHASTWSNGSIPPPTLAANDTIWVPANLYLKLDTALTVAATDACLLVDGLLNDTTRQPYLAPTIIFPLTLGNGGLQGNGLVQINTFITQPGAVINLKGTMTIAYFECHGVTQGSGNSVIIYQQGMLTLAENDYVLKKGHLSISAGSRVEMAKGSFYIPPGSNPTYDFTQPHTLLYTDTPANGLRTFGIEMLQQNAKRQITLKTSVLLTADFQPHSNISGGNLILNGHKLILTPAAALDNYVIETKDLSIVGDSLAEVVVAFDKNQKGAIKVLPDTTGHKPMLRKLTIDLASPALEINGFESTLILDTLQLYKGKLNIGISTLAMADTNSVITGNFDSSYIAIKSMFSQYNGKLYYGGLYIVLRNHQPTFYPIGTYTQYAPANITMHTTGYPMLNYPVSVFNDVFQYGKEGDVLSQKDHTVRTTWTFPYYNRGFSGKSADSMNIELTWNDSMEVNGFDRDSTRIAMACYQYPALRTPSWNKLPTPAPTNLPGGYHTARTTILFNDSLTKLSGPYSFVTLFDHKTLLSIDELREQWQVNIYPNPAKDVLHIQQDNQQPLQANIYDASGRVVRSATVNGNSSINIALLPAGMYYLQLAGENINATTKFVKH